MVLISTSDLIVASTQQLSEVLVDEAIILNAESGEYFGLAGVGLSIWRKLQEPISVTDLHAALLEEFEVESDACERDLHSLLEEMRRAGLIEVRDVKT